MKMFSIAFLVAFNVVFRPCFSIEMNVTRSPQDTFSVTNCTSCAKFNQATCLEEGVCRCPLIASTFFIYKQRCESPSSLINDQDCLNLVRGSNELGVIDLSSSSSSPFSTTFNWCSVPLGRTFEYLRRQGKWMTHGLQENNFDPECLPPVESVDLVSYLVLETSHYSQEQFKAFRSLQAYNQLVSGFIQSVQGHVIAGKSVVIGKIFGNNALMSFAGRIIRVDLLCKGSDEGERKSCLIFKAKGTIPTTGIVSPSRASVPTIQHGGARTTQLAATSERIQKPETKEPTTPRVHYVGSQSKPRFTLIPSNSTVITIAHINGAVSIDKTNKKDDTVVVAIISVLGAIACVLVIGALFAWFVIKYYKRFRPQGQRNTPRSTAVVSNNLQDIQNTISMATFTTGGGLSEPVYSELPDVVESANRNRRHTEISLPVDNQDDYFILRNPLQYNTLPLPRGRKLTDPLPATPRERAKTPDMRLTHRTTSTADPSATKTAQFLSDVSQGLSVQFPVFQDSKRRERSSTDVDGIGDRYGCGVFFENFPAKKLVVDLGHGAERPISKSRQSIYEDLSETSKQSRISVYEPLEKATLQPPDIRQTTLERINDQVCLEKKDSAPEYHVLEPSPEQETNPSSSTHDQVDSEKLVPENKDSTGTLSVGTDIRGPYSSLMTEHHVHEGPDQNMDQGCSNEGLEFDVESTVDKKSAQVSGKIFNDIQNTSPNQSKDGCSHGHTHGHRRRTSENVFLRPRSKSSEF